MVGVWVVSGRYTSYGEVVGAMGSMWWYGEGVEEGSMQKGLFLQQISNHWSLSVCFNTDIL